MRQIKFRAWDKKTKKMRAINSIAFHYEKEAFDFDSSHLPKVVNLWGHNLIEDKPIILHREPKEFELMQFTGLLDKNGKEIYEGDILCISDEVCVDIIAGSSRYEPQNRIESVEWDNEHGVWVIQTDNLCEQYMDSEIIGNIYENPELLK